MLSWRIARYTPDGVEMRLRHCNRMIRLLERVLPRLQEEHEGMVGQVLPGTRAHRHTLWLFPVMVAGGSEKADLVVEALLREGFDATRAPTSLVPISW